jgi:hypothetical protein
LITEVATVGFSSVCVLLCIRTELEGS